MALTDGKLFTADACQSAISGHFWKVKYSYPETDNFLPCPVHVHIGSWNLIWSWKSASKDFFKIPMIYPEFGSSMKSVLVAIKQFLEIIHVIPRIGSGSFPVNVPTASSNTSAKAASTLRSAGLKSYKKQPLLTKISVSFLVFSSLPLALKVKRVIISLVFLNSRHYIFPEIPNP